MERVLERERRGWAEALISVASSGLSRWEFPPPPTTQMVSSPRIYAIFSFSST